MRGQRADEKTRGQWRKMIAAAARSGLSTWVFYRERGVTEEDPSRGNADLRMTYGSPVTLPAFWSSRSAGVLTE